MRCVAGRKSHYPTFNPDRCVRSGDINNSGTVDIVDALVTAGTMWDYGQLRGVSVQLTATASHKCHALL